MKNAISLLPGQVTNALLFMLVKGAVSSFGAIRQYDGPELTNMIKDRLNYHLNAKTEQ